MTIIAMSPIPYTFSGIALYNLNNVMKLCFNYILTTYTFNLDLLLLFYISFIKYKTKLSFLFGWFKTEMKLFD